MRRVVPRAKMMTSVACGQLADAEREAHHPRVVLVDADNRVREEVAIS